MDKRFSKTTSKKKPSAKHDKMFNKAKRQLASFSAQRRGCDVQLRVHFRIARSDYAEEVGIIEAGTYGIIIKETNMRLVPGLTDEKYAELVSREVLAKQRAEHLVLIGDRVVAIPAKYLNYLPRREHACA